MMVMMSARGGTDDDDESGLEYLRRAKPDFLPPDFFEVIDASFAGLSEVDRLFPGMRERLNRAVMCQMSLDSEVARRRVAAMPKGRGATSAELNAIAEAIPNSPQPLRQTPAPAPVQRAQVNPLNEIVAAAVAKAMSAENLAGLRQEYASPFSDEPAKKESVNDESAELPWPWERDAMNAEQTVTRAPLLGRGDEDYSVGSEAFLTVRN